MGWPKGRTLTPDEKAARQNAAWHVAADMRRRKPRIVLGEAWWRCTACDCWFTSEFFFKTATNSSGLTSRCRTCHGQQSIRTRDPERHKRNKRESTARQRRNNPDRFHAVELRRSFGIDRSEYVRMLEEQGGVCAICRLPESDSNRSRLAVDHDHSSGAIRGLLCRRCNTALGLMGDCAERLEMAARYLRRTASVREAKAS